MFQFKNHSQDTNWNPDHFETHLASPSNSTVSYSVLYTFVSTRIPIYRPWILRSQWHKIRDFRAPITIAPHNAIENQKMSSM